MPCSGRVLAWGWNGYGQLGDGTNIDSRTPVIVQKLNGRVIQLFSSSVGQICYFAPSTGVYLSVSSFDHFMCMSQAGDYNLALLESGEVQAWGIGNSGQLGIGGKTSRAVPSTITGYFFRTLKSSVCIVLIDFLMTLFFRVIRLAGTVTSAAVGRDHSLCAAGALWAWGGNEYGQVASGDTAVFFDVPRTVTAMQGTVFVAAGFQHSFAISSSAT